VVRHQQRIRRQQSESTPQKVALGGTLDVPG